MALLLVGSASASAHRLHDADENGQPLAGYDANVKPPAVNAAGAPATATPAAPAPAAVFAPFAAHVRTHWDGAFFYVESDGMPDHPMMVGITAWQQQVPIPQRYFGDNAWRFPLVPVPAKVPLSAKDHFFRGAIALAANGVPIFNPIKNDGRTDTFLAGELDEFGGHAGRADDYHYHLAPVHLQAAVGAGQPVAYALDGYAIYGLTCTDGAAPRDLDRFNGHTTAALGYHYHATKKYPYLNGGFHGEVVEREGQVDPQPRAQGPRPATEPLRGATITGFKRLDGGGYQVAYEMRGRTQFVNYAPQGNGWKFEFVAADGTTRTETFDGDRRGGSGGGGGERERGTNRGDRPRGKREEAKAPRNTDAKSGDAPRQPWILVHAQEMDADHDGKLSRAEVAAETAKTFSGYDPDGDGRVPLAELEKLPAVRSALGGFVKQHAAEIDADHDGVITAAELGAVVMRMFERATRGSGEVPATQPAPAQRKGDA
jgi:hypothetical protein